MVLCVIFINKPVTALADTVPVKNETELQAAINSATLDRTIILEDNIDLLSDSITINSENSFIIDLNQKS